MMNIITLEQYLHTNIPISQAFGVHVAEASKQKIVLSAPYANNINHKKTVFGGSLHAVATLSCWCLLYVNLKMLVDPVEIVIAQSTMDYLLPVTTDFHATCITPEQSTWDQFHKALLKKGKARLALNAQILQQSRLAADFHGTFVALKRNGP